MVPTVNNLNKSVLPLNFQDCISSHLFSRKFCLREDIFLLGLFLLKLKWGNIYPGLHLSRDKEFGMSLTQLSVPFILYLKSLLKSIGCYAQLRLISSLERTFLKSSSATLLWHLPQPLTGYFSSVFNRWSTWNLPLQLPSAHYSWVSNNKEIMSPTSPPPHFLLMEVPISKWRY